MGSFVCTAMMYSAGAASAHEPGYGADPDLSAPESALLPTVNIAKAVGWPEGGAPIAASGLKVQAFARNLDHPRWIYVLPNGDVLIAESQAPSKTGGGKLRKWIEKKAMQRAGSGRRPSADRITLLRDSNGDGAADVRSTFLEGLRSPLGMALVGSQFYVANTDELVRFHYENGAQKIDGEPRKVLNLPGGAINRHWTKSLIASPDGRRLYVGVGSNSNIGERGLEFELGRAAIWEIDPASGTHRIFASGLRNPVGLAFEPKTGFLWTAVNERDELGNDLVPDYITSVQDGGFYGWPWSYFGQNVDARVRPTAPYKVAQAIAPDYAVGAHTASLGLAAASGNPRALTADYAQGMFVGQHGSWNRKPLSGYKVIFIPFKNGRPSGEPIDVLSGFLNQAGQAQGRPVGVAVDAKGALLVADDAGNTIWRVTAADANSRPSRGSRP